jgi:hypothetical protein
MSGPSDWRLGEEAHFKSKGQNPFFSGEVSPCSMRAFNQLDKTSYLIEGYLFYSMYTHLSVNFVKTKNKETPFQKHPE